MEERLRKEGELTWFWWSTWGQVGGPTWGPLTGLEEEPSSKMLEGSIGQLGKSAMKNEKLLKCKGERIEVFLFYYYYFFCNKAWIHKAVFQGRRYYIKRLLLV